MDATLITDMAQWVADVVETDGSLCTGIVMGECADGSNRHYALVRMWDATNELEQEYRITSPAPFNSPAWAAHLRDEWLVEVRMGDEWLLLDAQTAAERGPA